MQPAGPPVSRGSRTGLIVSIVVVALVLIGGGTTVLMLVNRPAPRAQVPVSKPVGGRYQSLVTCAKLTTPPFTFDPRDESYTTNGGSDKMCTGTFGAQRVDVWLTFFSGPKGEVEAVQTSLPLATEQDFQRLDGTGFENAPFAGYNGDAGPMCTATYRRSNEFVRIDFPDLPGGTDTPSCTSAIMPYVKQFYALIG